MSVMRLVPYALTPEMKAAVRDAGGPHALSVVMAVWGDLLASAPPAPPSYGASAEMVMVATNGYRVLQTKQLIPANPRRYLLEEAAEDAAAAIRALI